MTMEGPGGRCFLQVKSSPGDSFTVNTHLGRWPPSSEEEQKNGLHFILQFPEKSPTCCAKGMALEYTVRARLSSFTQYLGGCEKVT